MDVKIILLILLMATAYAEIIPEDRKADWNPGIPGGIPQWNTICANVKNAPYNAAGDGVTDDTNAIQSAIDNCPDNQVVYIPEGKYYVPGGIDLTKDNIVLRGDGPDRTLLFLSSNSPGISMGGGTAVGNYIDVTSGFQKGSTQITLADASSFQAGDYMVIDQENDPDYAESDGHEGTCTWCGSGRCAENHNIRCASWSVPSGCTCETGLRTIGEMFKVVSKNGNTLTIDHPLYWDYKSAYDPQVFKRTMTEKVGIEDLYITTEDSIGGVTIRMDYCAYCWIKNIESSSANQRHVEAYANYHNEFRDNYFHHVTCYIGNYGYGFALYSHVTGNLWENNIFYQLGSPLTFAGGGAGNVIAYNYFGEGIKEYPSCGEYNYIVPSSSNHHGAHPSFTLYEGNMMNKLTADFIWGSSSHITALRNTIRGYQPDAYKYISVITLQKYVRYANIVGNILGTYPEVDWQYEISDVDDSNCWYEPHIYTLCYKDGDTCKISECDSLVKQTLLRHGNYDYADHEVKWDPAISDHNIPDSYYLNSPPSWWDSSAWPPFGPDTNYEANEIPAKKRFDQIDRTDCGNGKPERLKTRIVIDNNEAEIQGSWEEFTSNYLLHNVGLRDSTGADPDNKATYTAIITEPGMYDVYYTWYRTWSSDSTAVPVKVIHGTRTYTTTVNMADDQDTYDGYHLGRFYFRDTGKVIIYGNATGRTLIDAVRFINDYEEECDDWNTEDGDGCTSECMLGNTPVCGNAIVGNGEQCDDGNTQNGDGCSSSCQLESGACIPMTLSELIAEINAWKSGTRTIQQVMESIQRWKNGC